MESRMRFIDWSDRIFGLVSAKRYFAKDEGTLFLFFSKVAS